MAPDVGGADHEGGIDMTESKVFFTDMHVTPEENLLAKLDRLIRRAGIETMDLDGKFVAVKIHFGEPGNMAFLRPNWARVVCDRVKALGGRPFLTDCNTLYVGGRKNALDHIESAYVNGYAPFSTGAHVIIADGLRGLDERLVPVEGGRYVKEAKIGTAIMDADVVISLAHFKGHEQTGFGGAIKNLGMGSGSRAGKMEMHSAGKPHVETEACIGCGRCVRICAHDAPHVTKGKASIDHDKCVGCGRCIGACPKDAVVPDFDEAFDLVCRKMAEYTKAVIHGRPNFNINMVIDVSPFCDCHAENDIPIVPDVGMFASFDPVALDKACADAVDRQPAVAGSLLDKSARTHGDHFTDVSPDTHRLSALEHAQEIGIGSMAYELIEI